jgi:hypothetical protein
MDTRGQKKFIIAANTVVKKRPNPVQESLSKNLRRPCFSSEAEALVFGDIQATHYLFYLYRFDQLLIRIILASFYIIHLEKKYRP